jgi:3-hydroxyisobutyrate dehydrogenase-like beta-hydroxyacid dehydrogenase
MKIGFIGLGTMGAFMAANLQKAGYALVIHDIAARGGRQPHRRRRRLGRNPARRWPSNAR